MTWDEDESRVSYHLDTYYVFDKDLSIGDPGNYTITTLNVPLLVSQFLDCVFTVDSGISLYSIYLVTVQVCLCH